MSGVGNTLLDQLFLDAHTHNAWTDKPVDDTLLQTLYAQLRMGPTSANSQPGRFLFVKSPEAKAKLRETLAPGNVDKTMAAPVTVVVAYDAQFHEHMHTLFPSRPQMKDHLGRIEGAAREFMLVQNSSLQAGYLILAARALGLDVGPMGGFDRAKVDEAFFVGSTWRSTLLINLGYGDPAKVSPRNPRLSFEQAARIV